MHTIPNEKMGDRARQVVGDLLQAKLYKGLMNTIETHAKAKRDVSNFAGDYEVAQQWLSDHGFLKGQTKNQPQISSKTPKNIVGGLLNNVIGSILQNAGRRQEKALEIGLLYNL